MSPKNVIFKKTCKDKSVGVFMGKRDFVDRVDSVDPVDGVVLIDPEALQCAVEFEIKAFSAESQDAKVRKR
uniref:S-antigen; retina and pineal gland (arrestin) a n=1 Tax=Poecilia latipinna TaxID=48699 RepID=A0A3B3VCS7_9TELE